MFLLLLLRQAIRHCKFVIQTQDELVLYILGKVQITASLTQTLGNRQNMKINIENIKSSGKVNYGYM